LTSSVETFTIQLGNVTPATADIQVSWEKTQINIPVVADIDAKISKSIETAMNVDNRPYFQAASYYFETGKDLKQALTWTNESYRKQSESFLDGTFKSKNLS
jgi:hypothetical protein